MAQPISASFRVPAQTGISFWENKNSRFHGRAIYVADEQEVKQQLAYQRQLHPEATAQAYAYTLGQQHQVQKFSDGGEPGGTAGLPMMEVIKKQGLCYTLVCVSRYFGGVHLGAGGLVRAFSHTAALALHEAGAAVLVPATTYAFAVPYTLHGRVEYWLENSPYTVVDKAFAADVTLFIQVKDHLKDAFFAELSALTQGTAACETLQTEYVRQTVEE